MPLEDVSNYVQGVRDKVLLFDPLEVVDAGAGGKAAEDLRKRLGIGKEKGDKEPAAAGGDGVPIEPADFRVLAVDYDDQSVRYKDFRAAVQESRDGSKYADWPFQTEPIALNMVKHFERHGGNCLLWLDKWSSSRGIEPTGWTAIELGVHMRSIHDLATYDQINFGANACAENILLRVAQIVEAYRSDSKRPNWAAVKHISGLDDATESVPSSLCTNNAKRTKEEVEAENLRMRVWTPPGRPWR